MARTYHVDIARHVAGVGPKWLDNILSHYSVPGVIGGRQGISRRINESGVEHIVLIWRLSGALGVPNAHAVSLATRLLDGDLPIALLTGVDLTFDRTAFQSEVRGMVALAVEAIVPARRGRPANRADDT